MAEATIILDVRPTFKEAIMEVLISDIGSVWDDYCYEKNVPSDIKLHGIQFLEHFAEELIKRVKE